jgi:hypothetical protein
MFFRFICVFACTTILHLKIVEYKHIIMCLSIPHLINIWILFKVDLLKIKILENFKMADC